VDEIRLKYGDTVLVMRKSRRLVGVKPIAGRTLDVASASRAANAHMLPESIGGFRLVNVAEAALPLEAALDALRNDPGVAVGTHVYNSPEHDAPLVPTGDIYVVFSETTPIGACHELLHRYHLKVREADGTRELKVRVTARSPNPVKVAAALQESEYVQVAEPHLAMLEPDGSAR